MCVGLIDWSLKYYLKHMNVSLSNLGTIVPLLSYRLQHAVPWCRAMMKRSTSYEKIVMWTAL